jgi:hypothetical protein
MSGTTAATLAVLCASLLLAVLVITTAGPPPVEPWRGDVRAEHRTRPAPEPARAEQSGPQRLKSPTAPPEAPDQPVQTDEPPASVEAPRGIAAPTAEAAVARYYEALDDRRFAAAWEALSPAVRTAFGGFEGWSAGFASTLSSRPSELRVTRAPGSATTVEHVLTATDRTSCGEVEKRFAVTWRLLEVDGAWLAESLTAEKRSGPAPAAACA